VRRFFPVLIASCISYAQQQAASYTYDLNGRPVEGIRTAVSRTPGGESKSQIVRNVNGREVPVSGIEDVVVSDSDGVKVIERTIRRYDPNGKPGPAEKVRIENRREADGSEHMVTTVRRADINGNLQLAERRTQVTRPSGSEIRTDVRVERPVMNGGLGVVERTEQQERNTGEGRTSTTATTYKLDSNGRLAEAARMTSEKTVAGAVTTENAAEYESAATGQMRLVRQTVTRAEALAGGSLRTEIETFEPQTAGRAVSGAAKPQLASRQISERTIKGNGTVEAVSVQFALPNEPNRLGELRKVAETVCTGDCGQK
jgi:hypothetical protein